MLQICMRFYTAAPFAEQDMDRFLQGHIKTAHGRYVSLLFARYKYNGTIFSPTTCQNRLREGYVRSKPFGRFWKRAVYHHIDHILELWERSLFSYLSSTN